ncbi:MAG: PAS domain-containing sensor histidine kinase [Cucumibacter sp.]
MATLTRFAFGVAVLIAALVGLFAVYDRARSISEAEVRLGLLARQVAVAVAGADLMNAQIALASTESAAVGAAIALYLTDANGRLVAATAERAAIGAHFDRDAVATGAVAASAAAEGDFGSITAIMPLEAALAGTGFRLYIATGGGILILLGLGFAVLLMGRSQAERQRQEAVRLVEEARAERRRPMHPGKATILNNLGFGLARWDEEGAMVWCNPAYRQLLGIAPDVSLSGLAYDAVLAQANRPLFYKPIDELDGVRRTEVVCDNGVFVLVEERVVEDGGVLTVASDITATKHSDHALEAAKEEQRRLARRYHEEKLKAEAASRAKTAFLAHLSHDIRTPLNHIIGFAELIQHQLFGPIGDDRYAAYVQDIKGSGERLLASFAQIFELAQLEAGNASVRPEDLRVSTLFQTLENRFGERAKRAGLSFGVSVPQDVTFSGDKQGLTRMLGNVIDNAIKFTPSGGKIKLAAWAADDGLVLEVTDTGIGMGEDRVALLSQPFILGESAFGANSAGLGLGLAIARAIAELSGGSLVIDSTPALGTTVAVALPRTRAQRGAQAAA